MANNGFEYCLTRDGQGSAATNLPLNGFVFTDVGNATSRDQYAALGQIQDGDGTWGFTSTGTVGAWAITPVPAIPSYVTGAVYDWIVGSNSVGFDTMNVSSLGAVYLYKLTSAGYTLLAANDLTATQVVEGIFNSALVTTSSFTGVIVGTTLTASVVTGTIVPGQTLTGSGLTAGTTIIAFDSASGGAGTYTVNHSQSISSEAMTGTTSAMGGGIQLLSYANTIPVNAVTGSGPVTANDIPKYADTTGLVVEDGYTVGTGNNEIVQLDGSARLPAVDGSQLTNLPIQTPSGSVIAFAGSSAPSGWLLCFGQLVSTTTYATLFAAIGTTFGSGTGTFGIPDLRGRSVFGADAMGGTPANRLGSGNTGGITGSAVLGASGGQQSHTLTAAEEASLPVLITGLVDTSGAGILNGAGLFINNAGLAQTLSGTATGGGGAHNVLNPALVMNYIIKT